MAHGPDLFSPTLLRDVRANRVDRARAMLEARTCHSWKLAVDGDEVITAPPDAAGAPGIKVFLRAGSAARVTDVDGTELLDLCMGYGAQLLGHGHEAVTAALQRQIAAGWQLGLPSAEQHDLARLIQAAAPANQRIAFCTSGSDATLLAMRAARAVTGKDVIGVFAGSFHGLHDYGLVSGEPDPGDGLGLARKIHLGAGIPRAIDQAVSVMPYGHPAAFDLIRRQHRELAAVVVEAVRAGEPHVDAGPWLSELAAVCRRAGVLFVLDETNTGFRLAYGGAQELFGLSPDLVSYGKAVGGGLPLGVVAGHGDIMHVFTGEADAHGIFVASTFAGNPLSVAASLGALGYAHTHRDALYADLEKHAARLARGFEAIAAELGVPARMYRAGSIIRIALGPAHHRDRASANAARQLEDLFAVLALRHGLLMQTGLRGYLSAAHTDRDITQALSAFGSALADLKADGAFVRYAPS